MSFRHCNTSLVHQLVRKGLVQDAAEFYRLKLSEISALDGMDARKANELFDDIASSKKREAWRVMTGLGIQNVGVDEARRLCGQFPSLDSLFGAGWERIASKSGVSESVARSIADWYADSVNRKLVSRLQKSGLNFSTT